MVGILTGNLNRGNDDLRLFELGKTYARCGGPLTRRDVGRAIEERRVLTLGAVGRAEGPGWVSSERGSRELDFFYLKADVARALDAAELERIEYRSLSDPAFHPTRAAEAVANGEVVARFGQLHPDVAAQWKLKRDVLLAEIDLEALYRRGPRRVRYRAPSKFPASERDLSFIFSDGVHWQDVMDAIERLALESLTAIEPLEVFRSGQVPAGSHSLLLRLRFQRTDRTLREEEVQAATARAISALESLGGTQRK
jgi:phenylalanyl-tRNA synthetase beta chain